MISPAPNRFFLVEILANFNSGFLSFLKFANLYVSVFFEALYVTRSRHIVSLSGLFAFIAPVELPLLPNDFNK